MLKTIKCKFKKQFLKHELRRNAINLIFFGDTKPIRFTLALVHLLLGIVHITSSIAVENYSIFGLMGLGLIFIFTGVSQLSMSIRLGDKVYRLAHDAFVVVLWFFYLISSVLLGGQALIGIVSEFILGLSTIWVFLRSGISEEGNG